MATEFPTPVAFDLDNLPKRTPPTREVDLTAANTWLATVQANGGASDGTAYENVEDARKAGNRIRRLLDNVTPEGQKAKMRTFPIEKGGFGFAVFLGEAKPRKQRSDAGSAKGTAKA